MSHYSFEAAQTYAAHHEKSLRTRLTTWRERQLLARALRALPAVQSILDVACGTGRFWPVLLERQATTLIAADNSEGMLAVARDAWPAYAARVQLLQTSIFDLRLPADAVDLISCMRFFHHLALPTDRARALAELHRVTRQHLLLSLWVDGNLQSLRRSRRDQLRPITAGFGPRRCVSRAAIESEMRAAGFDIEGHHDVARGWSMWRLYVLRKHVLRNTAGVLQA